MTAHRHVRWANDLAILHFKRITIRFILSINKGVILEIDSVTLTICRIFENYTVKFEIDMVIISKLDLKYTIFYKADQARKTSTFMLLS
jgi:hypothetical protein